MRQRTWQSVLRIWNVKIVSGMEGLLELARMPQTDILVTAVVGMIGIRPTMEGIKAGKDIALANKETLVTAGHLIMPMAKEHGVQILPVDSEHSAIFQALHGEKQAQVEKLLITASGGPFRGRKKRRTGTCDACGYPEAPELGNGTEDYSGFCNSGK